MYACFTKSDAIFSRILRRVTKEPVSHVAILAYGYVIHFNFLGLQMDRLEDFHGDIVYRVELLDFPAKLLDGIAKKRHAFYDFGALLYLGLRCMLPFLPRKNLWQCSGMFLCTEWVQEVMGMKPDPMMTPAQLWKTLVDAQKITA